MITLNDINIPSFVKVNKVGFAVLPPMENNLLRIRGKAGLYHMGMDYGERVFKVSITIIANQINGVMSASRTLAEWLHYKEPVKLVFADEPDKYYMVVPDGASDISEIVSIGQGELTFICVEPFAYGMEKEENFSPVVFEPFDVIVGGTAETFPQIELTMKEDAQSISLISDDGVITIGEPATVEQSPVDNLPMVKAFNMFDVSHWTSPIMLHDGSGVKTADLETNGYTTGQFSGNYGSGAGWHGAGGVGSLDAPIQDFEINMNFGLEVTDYKQIGAIEITLFDANNVQLGQVSFGDYGTTAPSQTFKARAGKYAGGTTFIDATHTGGVWMNMGDGGFGRITFAREGNHWWGYIARYKDSTGKMQEEHRQDWTDVNNQWTNKLAKVQIAFMVLGTNQAPQWMYISALWVHERLTLGASEVPIVAKVDDVFLIDNEKSILYKNGEAFYEGLNPSSNFIKFKKGLNSLVITPAQADVKISYKERWL